MGLSNSAIKKYQNDPKINKIVNVFVNFIITNQYDTEDTEDIISLCRYKCDEEISHIVDGMNQSIMSGD